MSRSMYSAFVCIMISLYLLNNYEIKEGIKISLKILIKHLIDVQSYFADQTIESIELKVNKDNNKILQMNTTENKSKYKCADDHRYKIRIIQRIPLIIYIENFLIQNEIDHLIELAKPLFKRSTIATNDGKITHDNYRTSSTADIERHKTPIVKCIEKRFAQFQGNIDIDNMEQLQVVKYTSEQEFKPHYDWFSHSDLTKVGGQRITSFFTYLYSNCSQGETEFIRIRFDKSLHKRFCDILICNEKSSEFGIRFRPLPGNSIFWFNVDEQGNGDPLTYHAGRPIKKGGLKIGLNTWTHQNKVFV